MSEDFLDKASFCKRHGITPRTVDAWVKKGRVERIQDVDLKAYFRLLPEGSVAVEKPPPWVAEIVKELRALREEVAMLREEKEQRQIPATVATPADEVAPATDAAPPIAGWQRFLFWLKGDKM